MVLGLLIVLVILTQYLLGNKSLEMGFFTDDWMFLTIYRAYISNPILDLVSAWRNIGSHNFSHSYYLGILYSIFGLDYTAFRVTNLILKTLATLSLYPLVLIIFRKRLVAFLATLIYAIHFSPFGLLDGPSRGEDFLAIIFMNLFLIIYIYLLRKNSLNFFYLFGLTILLCLTIFIDTTRMFPLVFLILLIEGYLIIAKRSVSQFKASAVRMLILYSPFVLAVIFAPHTIVPQLLYYTGLYNRLIQGNFQLFLIPFASLGSTFLPRDIWTNLFYKLGYYSLLDYLTFLIPTFLVFGILDLLLGFLTERPRRFFMTTLKYNFIFAVVAFFMANNWLSLPKEMAASVDPGAFLSPGIMGLFFLSMGLGFLDQWLLSERKKGFYLGLFLSLAFSILFIFLTWVFSDINAVFMEVHPYLGIPAIGSSIFIALILTLLYEKLVKKSQVISIFSVSFLIVVFFLISIFAVNKYFDKWLDEGMRVADQEKFINRLWSHVKVDKLSTTDIPPLIYLDTSEDYKNGAFYSEVIIWRLPYLFGLKYRAEKEGRYTNCDLLIIDKAEVEKLVRVVDGKRTIVRDKCGPTYVYKRENFYAFKLKGRDMYPVTDAVLKELGVEK